MSGADNAGDTGAVKTDNTPPPAGDWIAGLAPELRQVVEVKGYKTPGDVVQAYAHAQKAIGADKITLPNKDTGEWDEEARTKLGIPKDAAGYTVKRPENLPQGMQYDEAFEKAALPMAHKLGLTMRQVEGLMGFYSGFVQERFKTHFAEAAKQMEDAAGKLKAEWGTAYDTKIAHAKTAAKHFGGQGLIDFLNTSGMGNSPELMRAFAKIGAEMTEDQLKVGQSTGFGLTPEQARREAEKLMLTEAYQKKSHPEHSAVAEKVQALFSQAYAA